MNAIFAGRPRRFALGEWRIGTLRRKYLFSLKNKKSVAIGPALFPRNSSIS